LELYKGVHFQKIKFELNKSTALLLPIVLLPNA